MSLLFHQQDGGAQVAAFVGGKAVEGQITAGRVQFGVYIDIWDVAVCQFLDKHLGLVLEHGGDHNAGGLLGEYLVTGFPEGFRAVFVVSIEGGGNAELLFLFGRLFNAAGGQFPVRARLRAGEKDGDAVILLLGQQGGVYVGFVSQLLDYSHHFLVAFLGDFSAVVEHAVYRAFGKAAKTGDVVDGYFF